MLTFMVEGEKSSKCRHLYEREGLSIALTCGNADPYFWIVLSWMSNIVVGKVEVEESVVLKKLEEQ